MGWVVEGLTGCTWRAKKAAAQFLWRRIGFPRIVDDHRGSNSDPTDKPPIHVGRLRCGTCLTLCPEPAGIDPKERNRSRAIRAELNVNKGNLPEGVCVHYRRIGRRAQHESEDGRGVLLCRRAQRHAQVEETGGLTRGTAEHYRRNGGGLAARDFFNPGLNDKGF